MKALSVRQPWADMICSGVKWLEFRSRPTSHRGKLLICSSKFNEGYTVEIDGVQKPLPLGMMLAVVEVVGCRPVKKSDKDHPGAPSDIDGWYAWEFGENFDVLIPKPVRGSVNFFNIPDEEIESAPDGQFWYDYL